MTCGQIVPTHYILLLINLFALKTRHHCTFVTSLCKDTHNPYDVSITKLANLLAKHSNGCFRYLVLKTSSLQELSSQYDSSMRYCSGACNACHGYYSCNTLGSTPGALAFSRDMLLNILLVANWQAIATQ
eukprot:CCRYP_016172-RA/>CCRYP_016172-RA protein AED:0.41 eAED:0.86 QI:0/0/0/1/0/0/3/0/129